MASATHTSPASIAPRAAGAAAFARTAAGSLGRLLHSSKAVFVERRPERRGAGSARPDDVHFIDWPAWCKEHYCRHVQRRDPIALWLESHESRESRDGGIVCLSDLVSMRRLLNTPYFEAMLRPSGARFVLSVALRDGDTVSGVLSLVRDAAAGDFDTRDRELVRTLAPLLGAAYRGSTAAPLGTPIETALRAPADARFDALTTREREILQHVATGRANKEIARLLDLSPWTVKNHLRAIFEKTGVHTRTALCAMLLSD